MIKKYKWNFVLVSVFMIVVFIYYNYNMKKVNEYYSAMEDEYKRILIEDSISALVTSISHENSNTSRNNPNHAYLVLNNGQKRSLYVSHEVVTKESLDEVIRTNDILIKKEGADKILILRPGKDDTASFEFLLTDKLGYPVTRKQTHDD